MLVLADRGEHKAAVLRGAAYRADQLATRSGAGSNRVKASKATKLRERDRCQSSFSATTAATDASFTSIPCFNWARLEQADHHLWAVVEGMSMARSATVETECGACVLTR